MLLELIYKEVSDTGWCWPIFRFVTSSKSSQKSDSKELITHRLDLTLRYFSRGPRMHFI
jgi:hypothetical protein